MKDNWTLVLGILFSIIYILYSDTSPFIAFFVIPGITLITLWFYLREKKKQMEERKRIEQQREEERQRWQAEADARAEAQKKAKEERDKARAERDAAHNAMVATIGPVVVTATEDKAKEEAEQRRQEEAAARAKARAERDAAYNAMIAAIRPVTVTVTEEKAKKIAISFLNTLTYSTITARSNLEQLSNYVVIDTETTGLKCTSDEIIEVAAIRFRGFEPVEKFVTLLAPSKPIPAEITKINHITDEMVAGKPCFQQVAASLIEFIGNDNIVGHNLPFDLKFIVHYGANVTEKKRKYYDTLAIAQKTIKKARMRWDKEYQEYIEDFDSTGISDYQLRTLCVYLGLPYQNAHRAEADALAAGLLFQSLIDKRVAQKQQ